MKWRKETGKVEAHQDTGRDMHTELERMDSALISVTPSIFIPQTTGSKA